MKNQLIKKLGKLRDRILNKLGFYYEASLSASVDKLEDARPHQFMYRFGLRKRTPDGYVDAGHAIVFMVVNESYDALILEVEALREKYSSAKEYQVSISRNFKRIDHDPDLF